MNDVPRARSGVLRLLASLALCAGLVSCPRGKEGNDSPPAASAPTEAQTPGNAAAPPPSRAEERRFFKLAHGFALEALKHARALRPVLAPALAAQEPPEPTAKPASTPKVPADAGGGQLEAGSQACGLSPSYLALRRAIFAGKSWWRLTEPESSEVLLGPQRPSIEGGGNLGLLDAALEQGDCQAATRALFQVESALRLIALSLETFPEETLRAAGRLSLSAVELGGVLLESTPEVSLAPAGVRADALGMLDGIEQGVKLLLLATPPATSASARPGGGAEAGGAGGAPAAASRDALLREVNQRLAALRGAVTGSNGDLSQRARWVRETGKLGFELRQLVAGVGLGRVPPPFRAQHLSSGQAGAGAPDGEISVLSLPAPRVPTPRSLVELGRRLFFDKRLSQGSSRSCATCHDPGRGYADGKARAVSLDPAVSELRHVPTLFYSAGQASFLWDGRLLTAQRQAQRVIHSRAEMGLSPEELVARVSDEPALAAAFRQEFVDGVTAPNVGSALAAFQAARLAPGDAPLDRFARGDDKALSQDVSRGLDVFAGRGRCARCHVPPLFAGTRPNDFAISIFANIGLTDSPTGTHLDRDPGRFAVTRDPLDQSAFKTPSARNVSLTAPYFHNGAFKTLEQVVDFYNLGGGVGHGHKVPNQDPDVRPLSLTAQEKRVLLLFMREGLQDSQGSLKSTATAAQ